MANELNKNITIQVTADTSDLDQKITNLNQAIAGLLAQQKQLYTAGQQIHWSNYFTNIFCKSSFRYLFLQHKLFTMKKILLITFLLIPFLGLSQTTKPITGFYGIPFGSSQSDVIAAIKAKGGHLELDTANKVIFDQIKLGDLEPHMFAVSFLDDKAYEGIFFFKADLEARTYDFYNRIVDNIANSYGPGKEKKIFKSGFHDGQEVTAIENGYADISTVWVDKNNKKNSIKVEISDSLEIYLTYQNTEMSILAEKRDNEKSKADF